MDFLVIDDDKTFRDATCFLIEGEGHYGEGAASGEQALEQEVTETKSQNLEPIFEFSTPLMREVMEVLLRAAPTPASILILGESGTGKTVVARMLHQHSQIADRPFVTVSCPSLSKELL